MVVAPSTAVFFPFSIGLTMLAGLLLHVFFGDSRNF